MFGAFGEQGHRLFGIWHKPTSDMTRSECSVVYIHEWFRNPLVSGVSGDICRKFMYIETTEALSVHRRWWPTSCSFTCSNCLSIALLVRDYKFWTVKLDQSLCLLSLWPTTVHITSLYIMNSPYLWAVAIFLYGHETISGTKPTKLSSGLYCPWTCLWILLLSKFLVLLWGLWLYQCTFHTQKSVWNSDVIMSWGTEDYKRWLGFG
jgi:hypothetical protein